MDKLVTFLVVLLGWIFSLCLHEFSHSLVAYYGGDTTVKDKGYLTFNPFKYTRLFESLLLPLLFLLLGGIGLPGGAVYIETWRLRNRKWESAVALAGPLSNLVLAAVLAVILQFAPASGGGIWPGLAFLAFLQLSAVVLNLLPVPPFDGYGALAPFLDMEIRIKIARYSSLIALAVFLVLWNVPFVYNAFWNVVAWLARILQMPGNLIVTGYQLFRFWK